MEILSEGIEECPFTDMIERASMAASQVEHLQIGKVMDDGKMSKGIREDVEKGNVINLSCSCRALIGPTLETC